ncbi:MAG: hypothetical protein LCI02_10175 [Proteobacteria bacterium]|nr:hypothetical protein [Pseudomonadota bacterium]
MPNPAYPYNRASRPGEADDLSAPATQIVRDRDVYLGQSRDIGRRLAPDQTELFVSDDPALALQRELERLAPQFIALHDVGTSSSLRLLQSMSHNSGPVMRLAVRRQGHGVPLATLQFVEIAGSDGSTLRVYSTDVDADSHTRHLMARVLVSHARLAVLLFGDLPPHALASALQPLADAAGHDRWPSRQMLLIPLGLPGHLKGFAELFQRKGIDAQVAPRVARATDAWSSIGAAWNRLDEVAPEPRPGYEPTLEQPRTDDLEPTQPMDLGPGGRNAMRMGVNWFDYVQRCASVKGMISCCVFDRSDGHPLAHAGGRPPAEVLQALGEQLLATAGEIGAIMGAGPGVLEATVSFPSHHLLLRALPRHRGVVLHAVLDAATGNLAVAKAQLQRLDPD